MEVEILIKLTVEELIEINDFYNGATRIGMSTQN